MRACVPTLVGAFVLTASTILADPQRSGVSATWSLDQHVQSAGVLDYRYTDRHNTNITWDSTRVWADDIHRTTADPLVGFTLGYRSVVPQPEGITFEIWIYANNSDNSLMPDVPLWYGKFTGLPSVAPGQESALRVFPRFEILNGLEAPRDLWIAHRTGVNELDGAGLLVPYGDGIETIGRTDYLFLVDSDDDLIPDLPHAPQSGESGFWIEVFSAPTSSPLPAPSTGILLIVASGIVRRRRRPSRADRAVRRRPCAVHR